MNREPVLIVGALIAVAVAVLQEFGKGTIDSADDIVSIALPIIGAFIARSQVTPAPKYR